MPRRLRDSASSGSSRGVQSLDTCPYTSLDTYLRHLDTLLDTSPHTPRALLG